MESAFCDVFHEASLAAFEITSVDKNTSLKASMRRVQKIYIKKTIDRVEQGAFKVQSVTFEKDFERKLHHNYK